MHVAMPTHREYGASVTALRSGGRVFRRMRSEEHATREIPSCCTTTQARLESRVGGDYESNANLCLVVCDVFTARHLLPAN